MIDREDDGEDEDSIHTTGPFLDLRNLGLKYTTETQMFLEHFSEGSFDLIRGHSSFYWTSYDHSELDRKLSPEKILAIGLHRLGHGSSYVAIGPNFNVGRSTVLEAVEDVVDILLELKDLYIKFPETEEQVIAARESFQLWSALPYVVGAIDGAHVKIKTPVENGPVYFSRYQDHDIVVQGVVDGNMIFQDVEAGYPGSMHDARVLQNSNIFTQAENLEILTGPPVTIGGNDIRPYLVGDCLSSVKLADKAFS